MARMRQCRSAVRRRAQLAEAKEPRGVGETEGCSSLCLSSPILLGYSILSLSFYSILSILFKFYSIFSLFCLFPLSWLRAVRRLYKRNFCRSTKRRYRNEVAPHQADQALSFRRTAVTPCYALALDDTSNHSCAARNEKEKEKKGERREKRRQRNVAVPFTATLPLLERGCFSRGLIDTSKQLRNIQNSRLEFASL